MAHDVTGAHTHTQVRVIWNKEAWASSCTVGDFQGSSHTQGYKLQDPLRIDTPMGHSSFTKGLWKTSEPCQDDCHMTVAIGGCSKNMEDDLFGEKRLFAILGGKGTQQKSLRKIIGELCHVVQKSVSKTLGQPNSK